MKKTRKGFTGFKKPRRICLFLFLTFPIVGASRVEHLLESIRAGDVDLSAETVQYLEQGTEM